MRRWFDRLHAFFSTLRLAAPEPNYAHCPYCGNRLSEWFVDFNEIAQSWAMWCMNYGGKGGCGRLTPWLTHDEYRDCNE